VTLRIARAVLTCWACPSQWDAWTSDGQYLYLRYRGGIGTVTSQPSNDPSTWDLNREPLVEFGEPSLDGDISLDEFLTAAGLELAANASVEGERKT
jgi:hypothetical protein